MFTCEEQYFVDLEGDTDNEVFPLGIEAMEAEELVSDWCIALYVWPWFNSVIR